MKAWPDMRFRSLGGHGYPWLLGDATQCETAALIWPVRPPLAAARAA